jgi:hypothetical protein
MTIGNHEQVTLKKTIFIQIIFSNKLVMKSEDSSFRPDKSGLHSERFDHRS